MINQYRGGYYHNKIVYSNVEELEYSDQIFGLSIYFPVRLVCRDQIIRDMAGCPDLAVTVIFLCMLIFTVRSVTRNCQLSANHSLHLMSGAE